MRTHAEAGGWCRKVTVRIPDGEPVPPGARLVAYNARLVNPRGHYAGAPTCTLYYIPGEGYAAADIRNPAKD